MVISKATKAILDWAECPVALTFPYAAALTAVRAGGKHFIETEVLHALAHARQRLPPSADETTAFTRKFLDVVLDKYDNKYDYLSYTALPLLEQVRLSAEGPERAVVLQHIHDVTVCSLVGDAMRFELRQLEGGTSFLTQLLPDSDLIERRLGFALRSLKPSLQRLGFDDDDESAPIEQRASRAIAFCAGQSLAHSPFILEVSMQPVYVVHDEYLFLRILQTLDTTFVSVSTLLRNALTLFDSAPLRSIGFIRASDQILQEGLRHFHTLSTMQREAFSVFREFTSGASAIQSVNYKVMESLCSRPDAQRLESLAYSSVPTVQAQIRQGGVSLDDKLRALRERPHADPVVLEGFIQSLGALGETMTRWRHSHYGIAKKYLADVSGAGTGNTEGTPYLKQVKDIEVFPSISMAHNVQGNS